MSDFPNCFKIGKSVKEATCIKDISMCNIRRVLILSLIGFCLTGLACSHKPKIENMVPLTKVVGLVHVDGQPHAGIRAYLFPLGEPAEKRKQYKKWNVNTDATGVFSFGTYQFGDGVPAGEYLLAFRWDPDMVGTPEADRLGSEYFQKDKGYKQITVGKEMIDLGQIDLKSIDGAGANQLGGN